MDIFGYILCFALALCFISLYRNELIYKYRGKALEKIGKLADEAILRKEDWTEYFRKYDEYGGYQQMFFDITRWRYRSFYPDL